MQAGGAEFAIWLHAVMGITVGIWLSVVNPGVHVIFNKMMALPVQPPWPANLCVHEGMACYVGCAVCHPAQGKGLLLGSCRIGKELLSKFVGVAAMKYVGPEEFILRKTIGNTAAEDTEPIPQMSDNVQYQVLDISFPSNRWRT